MLFKTSCPITVTDKPSITNIVVNPAMNVSEHKSAGKTFFLLFNWSMEKPVISVMYTGIKGKIQGLIKVKTPAIKLVITGKFPKLSIMKVLPLTFFGSG